jgi:hypothetical protein
MFANKANMEKLEKTNKRALRFVINNNDAEYNEICRDEKQLNIYRRCIKVVATQMYKVKYESAPKIIQDLFTTRESTYDIRDNDLFYIPRFKTVTYGKKSFRYYGAKLWSCIPVEIKEKGSLKCFKIAFVEWLRNLENLSSLEFL